MKRVQIKLTDISFKGSSGNFWITKKGGSYTMFCCSSSHLIYLWAGVKIQYGPLLPDLTSLIIGTTLLFALLIADDGTSLLNSSCVSGYFLLAAFSASQQKYFIIDISIHCTWKHMYHIGGLKLVNSKYFAKFAKVWPCQSFALYGTRLNHQIACTCLYSIKYLINLSKSPSWLDQNNYHVTCAQN